VTIEKYIELVTVTVGFFILVQSKLGFFSPVHTYSFV